ncbi:MAG TPA: DUF1285 domain-containing protein [Myxococcaceae bacterium]|nr:DUF1285 domain-containing protein [Myxococcaceae bacterium]
MALPPSKRWHTREDSGLVLDRQGRWFHDGEPVEHPKIIEAFNTGLKPAGGGRFKLEFGGDWALVAVEDAAYQVLDVADSDKGLVLALSDRTEEGLDPNTLEVDADGVLTCRVKAGEAKARFSREAQVKLGLRLEVEENAVWLWTRSGRARVSLEAAQLGT